MILHSLKYELWRHRYLVGLFLGSALLTGLLGSRDGTLLWFPASYGLVLGLVSGFAMPLRQTAMLPVSRRDAWLVRWLMAVGGPAAGICLLTVAGGWMGTWFGGSMRDAAAVAVIATLIYAARTGTFMCLVALCERFAAAKRPAAAAAAQWSAVAVLFSVLLAAFPLPEEPRPAFVAFMSQPPGILWLLALPAVAAAFHRPAPGINALGINPFLREVVKTDQPPPRRFGGWSDPLTALPKLQLFFVRSRAPVMAGAVAGVAFLEVCLRWGMDGAPTLSSLFLFDGVPFAMPLLLMLGLLAMGGLDARAYRPDKPLMAMATHLRVLPVSRAQFIGALAARRAVGWLAFWIAMVVAQSLLVGVPASFRLDVLACIIGLDLLVDAWRLQAGRSAEEGVFVAMFVVGGVAAGVLAWSAGGATFVSAAAVVLGAAASLAAVPVYRRAIVTQTSLYRG